MTEPSESDLAMILNNPRRLAELRIRLSDISWWMRMTAEKIAKQANREDDCTGRFWEGRFKAQLLLDEASILACAMYVDLNPIRAAIAQSLEDSNFTGAKARIDDLKDAKFAIDSVIPNPSAKTNPRRKTKLAKPKRTRRWERSQGRRRSGWLSPIQISESSDPVGPDPSRCGRRASLKGFLSMSVLRYLELLDWTGRQIRNDKRGAIPPSVTPILEGLGIEPERWLDLVGEFGRYFKRASGSSIALAEEADRRSQNWLQGPGAACFS
jgi:hypothetical protein